MKRPNDKTHTEDDIGDREKIDQITSAIESCIRRLKMSEESHLYDKRDLVQEVWVRLLSDGGNILHKYDAERGASLEYYISVISRRETKNLLRKEKAIRRGGTHRTQMSQETMNELVGSTPEPMLEARDIVVKLNEWLHKKGLSGKDVNLFLTTVMTEQPTKTAERLGVTTQRIYNWQYKIRNMSRNFKRRTDTDHDNWHEPDDYESRDSSPPR